MKSNIIIALVFLAVGAIIGAEGGCHYSKAQYTTAQSDTLVQFIRQTDTLWKTIALTNNVPYTIWGHDTILVKRTEKITGTDTAWIVQYISQTDTVAYADTLRQKDEFKAELFDTLAGNRIIGRSLKWSDQTPIEVRTITNTLVKKSALCKVFLGVEAYGGKDGARINLDLAPAASLVFADRYMLDLGYYIFNQQITAGFKVKLSLK